MVHQAIRRLYVPIDDVIGMDVGQSTAQVFHPITCVNNIHVAIILHMSAKVIALTQLLNEYNLGRAMPCCIAAKVHVK